ELPAHFKDHNGRDALRVDPEDADIVRGLVASFESRAEREAKAAEITEAEETLMREVDDFKLQFQADPLGVIHQMVGDDADADKLFRTYLLNNPSVWKRHAEWFIANAYDEAALQREIKDAQVELRERRLNAQLALQT